MTSFKGFLKNTGPESPSRITKGQMRELAAAMSIIIHHDELGEPKHVLELLRTLSRYMEAYPTDQSCHTCDYERLGQCLEWKSEIPAEFMEKGCEKWKDEGVPF